MDQDLHDDDLGELILPPGSEPEDALLAELRQRWQADPLRAAELERRWEFEAAVRRQMQQVPVPADLQQQILARIEAQTEQDSQQASAISETVAPSEPVTVADSPLALSSRQAVGKRPRRSRSRRVLLALGGLLTTAALLLIWFRPWAAAPLGAEGIIAAADIYLQGLLEPGTRLDVAAPPAGFPLSSALAPEVLRPEWIYWVPGPRFLGRETLTYRLRHPETGTEADLLVTELTRVPLGEPIEGNLPTFPTGRPLDTAGRSAETWVQRERLYVLVVRGDREAYRQFLQSSRPVAWLPAWGNRAA